MIPQSQRNSSNERGMAYCAKRPRSIRAIALSGDDEIFATPCGKTEAKDMSLLTASFQVR